MGIRPEHRRKILMHGGRHRALRARTFTTEAQAKAWAETQGIKKFEVVRLNQGLSTKLKIVAK